MCFGCSARAFNRVKEIKRLDSNGRIRYTRERKKESCWPDVYNHIEREGNREAANDRNDWIISASFWSDRLPWLGGRLGYWLRFGNAHRV